MINRNQGGSSHPVKTMSEQIKVGDLVVAVRGCNPDVLGLMFRVSRVYARASVRPCCYCNQTHNGMYVDSEQPFGGKNNYTRCPMWWLKRIPPLGELDEVKRDEEITA